MNGDLPPSSSERRLPLPAVAWRMMRPDLGRAGEGDLVDAGVLDERSPVAPSPVTMLTTPGGRPIALPDLGEGKRGQRGELGRLEHHGVAHRQRRRDLPGQHQQREVPGDDLPDDADGAHVGQLGGHQLRPAGVVVEVARDQRDVDVARLADRLAVVDRLQHGEQARVLLDLARQRVEIARADVSRRLRSSRGRRRARRARRHPRRRRVACATSISGWPLAGLTLSKYSPPRGIAPLAVDEQAEARRVRVEPLLRGRGRLGRRAVAHRLEDLANICCAGHRRASHLITLPAIRTFAHGLKARR